MSLEANAYLHLTTGEVHDNVSSDQLMKFCSSLVRQSQWKSARVLHCGSRMENPNHLVTAQLLRIKTNKLDSDIMMCALDKCVASCTQLIPEAYTGQIVRIYNADTHAGYVKLIKDEDTTELLWEECRHVNPPGGPGYEPKLYRHGPAVLESFDLYQMYTGYTFSNPTANVRASKELTITTTDCVSAVHSPYWPVEAAEWNRRKRYMDLPPKSVIKQVLSYGCDFVQISHKFGDINEWRFSFSKAELMIIKSWTIPQRNTYTTLWLLNKKIEDSHMCSYYFKTVMLWACEELMPTFWREDLLVQSVCVLLIYMMSCLKSKFCPNYFIPANNMMDHFIDTDLSCDIYELFKLLKSKTYITTCSNIGSMVLSSANRESFVLPAWIKRAFLLYDRINYEEDNFTDLNRSTFEPRVWNAIEVELSDIHKGLNCQKVAVGCDSMSEKQIHNRSKSEMHFKQASSLFESEKIETLDNCHHILVRSFSNAFITRESRKTQTAVEDNNNKANNNASTFKAKTCLNLQKCEQKHSINFQSTNTRHFPFYSITLPVETVTLYSEWLGVSPTVNISWFIAKAYLANLYYTTNRDVSLIMKTCDDIIDVYKQTYKNKRFAERAFPVVLSTQWASIYDKPIQELIGFYSLCKYVWTQSSSRSVYLGVCPVKFAMYIIKLQTEPRNSINVQEYLDHVNNEDVNKEGCVCDTRVNNGSILLYCAIRNRRY